MVNCQLQQKFPIQKQHKFSNVESHDPKIQKTHVSVTLQSLRVYMSIWPIQYQMRCLFVNWHNIHNLFVVTMQKNTYFAWQDQILYCAGHLSLAVLLPAPFTRVTLVLVAEFFVTYQTRRTQALNAHKRNILTGSRHNCLIMPH